MTKLTKLIEESLRKKAIFEADEEVPVEDELEGLEDLEAETEESVEGTEEDLEAETEESVEGTEEDVAAEDEESTETDDTDEDFEDLDKAIEGMVGITEIQHTTSSTILDFEDGGQIMYVQPMISVQSETLNSIIKLIITDVKKTYASQQDEITGKPLNKTKYWKSIDTLIATMVRSQLTKSDNIYGLIDEIKQIFKVLEVK